MNFEFELVKTFSKSRKGKLSLQILLSALGVCIGVVTLINVMSAFDGYINTIESLLLSTTPHIQIKKNIRVEDSNDTDEVDEIFGDMIEEDDDFNSTSYKPRFYDTDEELETVTIEKKTNIVDFTEKNLFSKKESSRIIDILQNNSNNDINYAEEAFVLSSDIYIFNKKEELILRSDPIIYGSNFSNMKTALELKNVIDDNETVFREMNQISLRGKSGGILLTNSIFNLLQAKGINIGDKIFISQEPNLNRCIKVQVLKSFSFGLESDSCQTMIMDLNSLTKLFNTNGRANTIGIKIYNRYNAKIISDYIDSKIPEGFYTINWIDMTKRVFNILQVMKVIIYVTLFLTIIVASFNIKNSLTMIVLEKRKQIAVLKAIGAKNSNIYKAFMGLSIAIGTAGMFIGLIVGYILILYIQNIQSGALQEMLGMEKIIFFIDPLFILILYISLIFICIISALSPSIKASNISPVEGLQ